MKLEDVDVGMRIIRRQRGAMSAIARGLGVSTQSIHEWQTVPLARVFDVSRITGIEPQRLRPDFFKGVYVVMLKPRESR